MGALAKKGNVGHVSVETTEIYASIWPYNPLKSPVISEYPKFHPGYQKDEEEEGFRIHQQETESRKPDYMVDYYSLDAGLINESFKQYALVDEMSRYPEEGRRRSGPHEPYVPFGRGGWQGNIGHNCTSLSWSLLKEGNIQELITSQTLPSLKGIVTTPNTFVEKLILAKRQELKRYPQTEAFSPPDPFDKDSALVAEKRKSFLVNVRERLVQIIGGGEQTRQEQQSVPNRAKKKGP